MPSKNTAENNTKKMVARYSVVIPLHLYWSTRVDDINILEYHINIIKSFCHNNEKMLFAYSFLFLRQSNSGGNL